MEPKIPSDGNGAALQMTSERLRQLLDAYGAGPDRWPPEEREAALAFLENSSEARAERDRAARLDAVLDRAPAEQPSPGLTERVLAASPAKRVKAKSRPSLVRPGAGEGRRSTRSARMRLWRYLATAAPLAAAATLAFWLTRALDLPRREESMQLTIAELGAYQTPMDVLLEPLAFDLIDTVPSLGCTDSGLGCPELDFPREIESGSLLIRRTHA
jgi:hypothetical protein